nr:glutathione S-transferase T3-like [Tanacetum cinerariifolium]
MSQPPKETGYFSHLFNSNPQQYSSSPNQSNPSIPAGKQPVVEVDEDDDDEEVTAKRVTTLWNRDEEILLAKTWIKHSQGANIGKDQQDDIFWNLIMQDFNSRTKVAPRTTNMMTGKWTRMHGDCQRFNAIYKHLTRKSRESDVDLVENAKTSYMERYGNKKFINDHAWNILKNYPKLNAAEPIDVLLELLDKPGLGSRAGRLFVRAEKSKIG